METTRVSYIAKKFTNFDSLPKRLKIGPEFYEFYFIAKLRRRHSTTLCQTVDSKLC